MTDFHPLTCEEVDDLAALFVLDALEAGEAAAVVAHLATCGQAHESVAELAAVTPALAAMVEPVDAPAALRDRVLAAVAASPQERALPARRDSMATPAVAQAAVPPAAAQAAAPPAVAQTLAAQAPRPPVSLEAERARRRPGSAWIALAAAAVIAIAGLLGWNVIIQGRAAEYQARVALLRDAIAASTNPTSKVALLAGSGPAADATGFAVFPAEGAGYIVLQGLPAVPGDRTYQAWYLVGGQPASAGLMAVGDDGLAVLTGLAPLIGTDTIALTVEPSGGSPGPTTAPIVVGQLPAPLALIGELALAR